MEVRTDEELIRAYLDGEKSAFEILVKRYLKPVYGFVFRYVGNRGDSEDITQDVFVSAWKNLKRFDATRKFKTWLFTIAKNASLNWLKKKKPSLFSEFTTAEDGQRFEESIEDSEPVPEKLFERANLKEELEKAIGELNPIYQTTLLLYYTEDFSFQEIADIENESVNTVKSRHLRALAELRKLLNF